MYIIINQPQSKFEKSRTDTQTNTDRHTHIRTHTHTHTPQCHYDLVFFLFTICLVDTPIESLSPTELGSASTKVSFSVKWVTWHLTLLSSQWQWYLHLDCATDLEGEAKSVDGHLWQQEHKLTPSLTLHTPNCIFPCHYLKFLILFFFCLLAQSVCFAHCRAAGSFVCTFVLSHHPICVVLSFTLPAKSQLPDNLTGIG